MSNYKTHAMREFRAAGWTDENGKFNDEMQELICNHVLKLIDIFSEVGHSGSTAPYAISLFKKIASFEPIAPLTGEDDEWIDVSYYGGGVHYQNKRLGTVFKDSKDSQAYWMDGRVFWEWAKFEDGEMFKSYYTNSDSRIYIDFPWTKPEHPEYVFVPTEEFPNEV